MRPALPSDQISTRPRKSSLVDPTASSADRSSNTPTTFFLSRDNDLTNPTTEPKDSSQSPSKPLTTLQDAIGDGELRQTSTAKSNDEQTRNISRRRSTIKAGPASNHRRGSSSSSHGQLRSSAERGMTPSPLPSRDISLPSSPKSTSSRLVPKSDDELTTDDSGSQAITSGDDEENEVPSTVEDSQPELIMPSIKMPSRRPFTARGKRLDRFKILVAGQKGSGKTSLIKSIVQLCEDIVHVDPLSAAAGSLTSTMTTQHPDTRQPLLNEIYASTKPYPSWWSDIDDSRILRRRKSVGDSVLERNICFIDTSNEVRVDRIMYYVERQLSNAIISASSGNPDFAGMLSGRGGSQVDVVLYLVSKECLREDQENIDKLAQLSNVIPLIAKSDLLTSEDLRDMKETVETSHSTIPTLPALHSKSESAIMARAPYTISSVNGPDLDTMDASLLMSPEYVQPLLPSELNLLLEQMFDADVVQYLKHTAAKKLIAWHITHPKLMSFPTSPVHSTANSTLASPLPMSLSNSGVLIPMGSDLSLTTSNSYALARVADHTQREERLAQVRLSKWASDLQLSLQRERERYESLARSERALWLVERMGEEVRGGQIFGKDNSQALVRQGTKGDDGFQARHMYQMHDPLGLLQLQDTMRTRGWIALQVVGGFGVIGGLAIWIAKTWGFTSTFSEWAQSWNIAWSGNE